MASEVNRELKQRAAKIVRALRKAYPAAKCSLTYKNPLQLLLSTILSAQCTDDRVNKVTPALFARFKTAGDFARAKIGDIETMVRSTGFFRNKARGIQESCRAIVDRFGGRVPDTMDDLLSLHGVARKTANVVLGNAFGKNEGVVVDTHVFRITHRLGLVRKTANRDHVERQLMEILPKKDWTDFSHLLIHHGRAACKAPTPRCPGCPVEKLCPKKGVIL